MTDLEAQRAMVQVVLDWLRGAVPTDEFIKSYWTTRRELLDSNWSAFEGSFGRAMSPMDTAADSYRAEDRADFEIDEAQLRSEAKAVVEELRRGVPEVLGA